jgi:hypothetical protein
MRSMHEAKHDWQGPRYINNGMVCCTLSKISCFSQICEWLTLRKNNADMLENTQRSAVVPSEIVWLSFPFQISSVLRTLRGISGE